MPIDIFKALSIAEKTTQHKLAMAPGIITRLELQLCHHFCFFLCFAVVFLKSIELDKFSVQPAKICEQRHIFPISYYKINTQVGFQIIGKQVYRNRSSFKWIIWCLLIHSLLFFFFFHKFCFLFHRFDLLVDNFWYKYFFHKHFSKSQATMVT